MMTHVYAAKQVEENTKDDILYDVVLVKYKNTLTIQENDDLLKWKNSQIPPSLVML